MTMTLVLIAGAVALLLSLSLTPAVRHLATVAGITDAPGPRRIHARPIPRSGGVAVAVAVVLACGLVTGMPSQITMPVLAGAALLLVIGLADDVLSLSPRLKLLGQVAAALLAVAGGLRLSLFASSETGGALVALDAGITVLWIVFVTNAVNLTDGLDGLASGIGVMAMTWLTLSVLRAGDPAASLVPIVLSGALLGFLAYNFNPASIFLGDAGSLVIGYALAVLPLAGTVGHPLPPLAVFLFVAVPVTDTLLAIARRFLSRCVGAWGEGRFWFGITDGLRNTVNPDRRHIHHRLLDLGFTQRRAVLMLYLAAGTTGALGYLVAASSAWPVDLFAVGFGVSVIAVVQALGFDELQPARSGIFLPLLRRLARHRSLLVVVDAGLVVATYGAALWIVDGPRGLGSPVTAGAAFSLMTGLQLALFAVTGVYRTAWRAAGVSGLGLLVRACAGGAVGGYMVLGALGLPGGAVIAVVYFSLLLSVVALMRLSYVMLAHAAQRMLPAEPALICGTVTGAHNALAYLRQTGVVGLKPVGLVTVRPRWQGRQVEQLPVLGTIDTLPTLIAHHGVRHLIVADPSLEGELAVWVRAVCRHFGVETRRYIEKLVAYDEPLESAHTVPGAESALTNGRAHGWQTSTESEHARVA
jgi:UDP-GlcNAc:undecaprenyl-phosphate GlcNAc-1-phosphate transferase